jgi:hypothetical protein
MSFRGHHPHDWMSGPHRSKFTEGEGMKRAITITVGLVVGFMTMGIAFGATAPPPEIDNAAAVYQVSSAPTQKAPTPCKGEDFAKDQTYYASANATVTARKTHTGDGIVDLTPVTPAGDRGDFTLNATPTSGPGGSSGLRLAAQFTLNTVTGRGIATGSFTAYLNNARGGTAYPDKLFGPFSALIQVTDTSGGADKNNQEGVGRGTFATRVFKYNTTKGKYLPTADGLLANTEFVFVVADANDGGVVKGFLGTNAETAGTPDFSPKVPDFSVKYRVGGHC